MTKTHTTANACVDCYGAVANGITYLEHETDSDSETVERVRGALEGYAGRGLIVACGGGDDENDEEGFSWQPCDICKSRLGGDRFTVAIFER